MPKMEFDAILLEYHGKENRRAVDRLLGDYVLVAGEIRTMVLGVFKYARRSLIREEK